MTVSDLMEQGIRAYTRGQLGEAERCWRDVLAQEPDNGRAASYLSLLTGKLAEKAAGERAGPPVPLPAPAAAPPPRPAALPAITGPVPLPAPAAAAPAWSPAQTTESLDLGAPAAAPAPRAPAVTPPPTTRRGKPPPLPERTTLSEYAPSPWDQGPAVAPPVELGEGVGLDLSTISDQSGLHPLVPEVTVAIAAAEAARPRSEVEIWMEGARELFALGDFSGSLEMIEKILKVAPGHVEAREYLKQNEATLIAMYESKLGPPDAVPRLAIKPEEVMWLNLDHRAGFLLAQIDGTVRFEDLFALSGLPRLDTARILATLMQEGVIGVG